MKLSAVPARSRVGYQSVHKDGTTHCQLEIPLGHPAAKRRDNNGHVFEIEHAIEYAAGPGNQALRWINPATQEEEPVGEDLLPTSDDDAVRISASNLAAYLRKAARLFDSRVRSNVSGWAKNTNEQGDGRTATDSRFPCRRGRSHHSPLLSAAG